MYNFSEAQLDVLQNATPLPLEGGWGGPPTSGAFSNGFKPKLLGLTGKARSGKDTVGSILKRHFPASTISLASPIRDSLKAMIGLQDQDFQGKPKETPIPWLGKSPRQMMQTLGTEWGRGMVNENMWLLLAQQKIDKAHNLCRHAVITDVRFENEATFIREQGGTIWHIDRDTRAYNVSPHASEAGVVLRGDLGDVLICNYGNLNYLEDQVLELFQGE